MSDSTVKLCPDCGRHYAHGRVCCSAGRNVPDEAEMLRAELRDGMSRCGSSTTLRDGIDRLRAERDDARAALKNAYASLANANEQLVHALASEKQMSGYLKEQTVRANKFEAANIGALDRLESAERVVEAARLLDATFDQAGLVQYQQLSVPRRIDVRAALAAYDAATKKGTP